MERIGILEMAEIEVATTGQTVTMSLPADVSKHDAFYTMMRNDFSLIPEGFTGVYFRNEPYQVVPNAVLPEIMKLSTKGFAHVPEDFELFLFISWSTPEGKDIGGQVIELMAEWMEENL